jgi:hypothetical protein
MIVYTAPVTLTLGASMAAFLTSPLETIPGVALGVVSVAAFATVHCIRVNRRRRERHKKQDIC